MPIYEYRCPACGREFEELVRNARDEAELVCPACGAGGPERRLSACAVRVGDAGANLSGLSGTSGMAAPGAGGCGGGGGFS